MRGLFRLTWLEIKIFLREPMGSIGSVVIPVIIFIGLGRTLGGRLPRAPQSTDFVYVGAPIFSALPISTTCPDARTQARKATNDTRIECNKKTQTQSAHRD